VGVTRESAIDQLSLIAHLDELKIKEDTKRREVYVAQENALRDKVLIEYLDQVLAPIFGGGCGGHTDNRKISYWANKNTFTAQFTYDGFRFMVHVSYNSTSMPFNKYNSLCISTKRRFHKAQWTLVKNAIDVKALLDEGLI
jgi:hypothetical protein